MTEQDGQNKEFQNFSTKKNFVNCNSEKLDFIGWCIILSYCIISIFQSSLFNVIVSTLCTKVHSET